MAEVLLSLFVLTIGLVTIVSVMAGSLRYSYDTRDTIIAAELAQEGVELVRNARDNNFDPIVSGGTGFADFFPAQPHCRMNWDDASPTCFNAQGAADNYYLQYSGGLYKRVDATKERYSRYIYINHNNAVNNERAIVRSFVYWGAWMPPNTGNPANCTAANKCVYAETFLTAWK